MRLRGYLLPYYAIEKQANYDSLLAIFLRAVTQAAAEEKDREKRILLQSLRANLEDREAPTAPKPIRRDLHDQIARFLELKQGADTTNQRGFGVLVDVDADLDLLANFLATLSEVYGEISGSDELIIRDGRIPAVTAEALP